MTPDTPDVAESRKRFEAWWSGEMPQTRHCLNPAHYEDVMTQISWEVWEESRKQTIAQQQARRAIG